ncbi:DUF6752 domain-containing protein [Nocardioides cheoyonin]|uniref:DUF6752 domain-containing protein n=1 Tax=Nocardioides cheoyonin TaxID=3156615 RepID=UPI0032B58855
MPARDLTARALVGYRRLRERTDVYSRLAALEAEVQEQRQLNRRIAELTDVVAELLIPLQDRDPGRAEELLDAYRARI